MNSSSHPELIGRYQIQRLIGAGGMGDVYLARDPNIERQLAIKTVRLRGVPAEIADHKRRLLREAKAAGRLVHPNVVTLFDAGEADGLLYLAFEFVDGPDLGRRMKTEPPLTLRHSLTLVRQIAAGLDFAHQQGIIHRDIKPSNILIDPRGQAKIADFGLAKMNDESVELTRTGSVVGSPQYMSPEQVRGEALDGRTDIFSLGVLFYELMSSQRPFGGQTISTLVYEILSKEPMALAQLRPDLPDTILGLVRGMLNKDLHARVSTVGQVATQVDQVLATTSPVLLDGPAVRPVSDNAPTTMMSSTPAPMPPPAPSSPPSSQAPMPSQAHPPSAGIAASGGMAASGGSVGLPSATASPTSGSTGWAPPPPPPHSVGSTPQASAAHSSAVQPPASQPSVSQAVTPQPASGGSKLWIFALAGGFLLLTMALGVWWLGSALRDGLGRDDAATTVAEGAAESSTDEPSSVEGSSVGSDGAALDASTSGAPTADSTTSSLGEEGPSALDGEPRDSIGSSSSAPESRPGSSGVVPPREDSPAPVESTPRSSSTQTPTPPVAQPAPPPAVAATPPTTTIPAAQEPSPSTSQEPWLAEFDAAAAKAHREMTTGKFFKFQIEPKDAVVRLWQRGEERQVVLGQAQAYSAKDRNGRSAELPADGDYLFTFIADGLPNFTVLVHASSGGGTKVIRGSMANAAAHGPQRIRVSRSVAFNGHPQDATVVVDGVPRGPASKWPGGMRPNGPKNLQLETGRHRIVLKAAGYAPHEILVEVSPGSNRRAAVLDYDLKRVP